MNAYNRKCRRTEKRKFFRAAAESAMCEDIRKGVLPFCRREPGAPRLPSAGSSNEIHRITIDSERMNHEES